jgi:hypothetical protein
MHRWLERKPDILKAAREDAATIWVLDRAGQLIRSRPGRRRLSYCYLVWPNPVSTGVRVWAGNPPNILNVTSSRARHNLHVVGSQMHGPGNVFMCRVGQCCAQTSVGGSYSLGILSDPSNHFKYLAYLGYVSSVHIPSRRSNGPKLGIFCAQLRANSRRGAMS